jgi:signal transduction histidine kinase
VAIVLIIILAVALAVAIAFGAAMWRDVGSITAQLAFIRRNTTNAHLTTRTFFRRITALETVLNELFEEHRHASLENRRAEAALQQALTNISHDLRTPLTSAHGYLQLAEDAETDETHRTEYLRIVGDRLDVLTSLIDQLFTFTRIVEGRALTLTQVDLAVVLREVLVLHYEEFEQAGLAVELTLPEIPTLVIGDVEALRRVFENLVANAIAHGTERLAVRLDRDAREVSLVNRIPPEDIPALDVEHLFDRFYTADASRSAQSTGLGLAIVKVLAERMNARVSATLEGDLFEIRLKFAKDDVI